MTNHKATTRQWSGIERFVRYGAYDSCIIELRDRVEALEASTAKGFHHIGETNKMVPDGSLVERVAYAITGDSDGPINWKPEARAAILAVADWLDQQELHSAATRLRMEAQ
jgi:hypothetical protein